jgi:hypothetical protein
MTQGAVPPGAGSGRCVRLFLTVVLSVLALGRVTVCSAQTPAPATSAAPSSAGVHWTFGLEERIRFERTNNLTDHSDTLYDQRALGRVRSRVWAAVDFGSRATVTVGLLDEERKNWMPRSVYVRDELVFDRLSIDLRFPHGWTVRAGRQPVERGEGFALRDGTPLDGARSTYSNALIVSRAIGPSVVELIGLSNPRRDRYLPRWHEPAGGKTIAEWDEQAIALYSTTTVPAGSVEAYGLVKWEHDDPRSQTTRGYQPDRRLQALGSRFKSKVRAGWSFTGELVGEWGRQDQDPVTLGGDVDVRAWGGYAYARRNLPLRGAPFLELGTLLLSGDDPSTRTIEAFDPLFARWPKYGDMLGQTMIPESRQSYVTNMKTWFAAVQATPVTGMIARAVYYHSGAFERGPLASPLFADGMKRGDLFQGRCEWTMSSHWRTQSIFEYFVPGDFYTYGDGSYSVRMELYYTFTAHH